MPRFCRLALALSFALVAPLVLGTGPNVRSQGLSPGLVVQIDAPSPAGHNYAYLDYFSRSVTVHTGDVVTWKFANTPIEPHTVTLLPANTSMKALDRLFPGSSPGPDRDDGPRGGFVLQANQHTRLDCGGSPYAPLTGPCPYDGHHVANSGFITAPYNASHKALIPGAPPTTFSVRVTAAPGMYHYFCIIHGPHMSGIVRVVPAGAPADTQATVNARAARQLNSATAHALAFQSHLHVPTRVVNGHTVHTVFNGAGYGHVAINEFIPARVHVAPGDTVFWTPGFHTITFPAESGTVGFSLLCETAKVDYPPAAGFADCGGTEVLLNPKGFFPSGPPGQAYTGGFYNSGVLVIPKPKPWTASFPQGGTFKYDCLIHPGMDGSVIAG